jgi:hypothetical protein
MVPLLADCKLVTQSLLMINGPRNEELKACNQIASKLSASEFSKEHQITLSL